MFSLRAFVGVVVVGLLAAGVSPAAGQIVGNLVITPGSVPGGAGATATVNVFNFGAPGSINITDNGSPLTTVPATVAFGAAATQVSFPITTRGTPTQAEVTITVSAGNSVSQVLTVTPTTFTRTFTLSPSEVIGGTTVRGTFTVSPRPGVPLTINFFTSDVDIVVPPVPHTIPAGGESVSFDVLTLTPGVISTEAVLCLIAGTSPSQGLQHALTVYPRTVRVGPGREFTTIGAAISAVISGCQIVVDPGTYPERLLITNDHVAVLSAAGPGVTTIDGGGGGAAPTVMCMRPPADPESDWLLRGFTITGGAEAGVIQEHGRLRLEDCIVTGNSGSGGTLTQSGVFEATNCLFVASTGDACAIFLPGVEDRAQLVNCTLIRGAGAGAGSALSTFGPVNVFNSILRGGSPTIVGSRVVAERSNIEGGFPGLGNISGDPMFAGPADFRLTAGSPCIDAADAMVYRGGAMDLGLLARAVEDAATPNTGIGYGPPLDLGAYEFQAAACRVDMNNNGVVNSSDISAFLTAWLQAVTQGCP